MRLLIGVVAGCVAMSATAENLVKNSDFGSAGDFLDGWKFETIAAEVFNLKYDNDGKFVDMESTGPDYSAYVNQYIPVKSNTHYSLRVMLRLIKGRSLIWVTGNDLDMKPLIYDQRKYLVSSAGNPLVPDFVRKELMNGSGESDWRVEELTFFTGGLPKNSKEIAFVKINVGIYFSTGRIQIKKVELTPIASNTKQE